MYELQKHYTSQDDPLPQYSYLKTQKETRRPFLFLSQHVTSQFTDMNRGDRVSTHEVRRGRRATPSTSVDVVTGVDLRK